MYGCDCDGTKREQLDTGVEGVAIRATLGIIEKVAGHRPPTCPWRAFSEPIVREVLKVSWAAEANALGSVLGPDPDAKLGEAIGVYRNAVTMTRAEERDIRDRERDAKGRARAAAAKAGVRA